MAAVNTLDLALAYIEKYPTRYLFPIKANTKFPPLIEDNLRAASNDPEQIKAWGKRWPGCNWGIALAKSNLLAVDVDMKPGKEGAATFTELQLLYGFPETEQTITPSGGVHHLYAGRHVFALGKHGFGKDVDSPNYIIMPGCPTPEGDYVAQQSPPIADVPDWFYEVLGRNKADKHAPQTPRVELDQPENIEMAVDYLKQFAPASIEGQGGEKTLFDVAARLKDMGISYDKAVELLGEHYNRPWDLDRPQGIGYCEPMWEMGDGADADSLPKKVSNAYTYAVATQPGSATTEAAVEDAKVEFGADPPEPLTKEQQTQQTKLDKINAKEKVKRKDKIEQRRHLLDTWVYIENTGLFYGRNMGRHGELPVRNVELFNNSFSHLRRTGQGMPTKITTDIFNNNLMRRFETVGYKPMNDYIPNESDIVDREVYNVYRPSKIVAAPGDTTLWNQHLDYLFPDQESRDHVLNWCAWVLQNLSEKPTHALLVAGKVQGTGKTLIARVMELLIGKHNSQPISEAELTGQFNEWALRGKFVWIEELRTLDKRHIAEKLHPLITQARGKINEKNVKRFTAENYAAFFFMTNHDAAVPLDDTDRRYLVVRTHAVPKPEGATYYEPLYAILRSREALAAIAWELLHRDLKGYSGQDRAPFTRAKQDMAKAGWSDLEHYMIEHAHEWPIAARVTSVDDIVEWLPARLARTNRLHSQITAILRDRFQGIPIGQTRIGHDRKSLWLLHDSKIAQVTGAYGAAYEADKKNARKGYAADVAKDFGEEEQTNE